MSKKVQLSHDVKSPNRYWGANTPPRTKAEFFNAVTEPKSEEDGGGSVATIRLYGPIDSWGGWWGISTQDVGNVLDSLDDSVDRIVLRINSPGGEVFEAVSILNMLRAHKATVTAVVDGLAASAASVIAAGCDVTVMSPGTQMMIHSPLVFTYGNAADLRKDASVLDTIEASIIEIYQDKAGDADWPALLAEETWYTGAEAVAQGLADRVAVVPDSGEAETVGGDPLVVVEVEDLSVTRVAARAGKTPDSSEPVEPNRKGSAVSALDTGLAKLLGVTDAAVIEDDEALLAAVEEVLEEQAEETETEALPEGVVTIDEGVLAQLRTDAQMGRTARESQVAAERDRVVDEAVRTGRITVAAKASYRALMDEAPESTAKVLADLQPSGALPVVEAGISDDATSTEDERLLAKAGWKTQKEEVA